MIEYYYKDGNPIIGDQSEVLKIWGLLHQDMNYRRVGDTRVGGYWVSTVWLGLDHSFGSGPPIIFETLVFTEVDGETDFDEVGGTRYATEQDAIDGHNLFVEQIEKGLFVAYGDDRPEYYQIDEESLI